MRNFTYELRTHGQMNDPEHAIQHFLLQNLVKIGLLYLYPS
jgi:hypothetical protein